MSTIAGDLMIFAFFRSFEAKRAALYVVASSFEWLSEFNVA